MFLSRNVPDFIETHLYDILSYLELNHNLHIKQKNNQNRCQNPVHWNCIGDLLDRHFEPIYSYLRQNANMFGCFSCVLLFGLPYAGPQTAARSDS